MPGGLVLTTCLHCAGHLTRHDEMHKGCFFRYVYTSRIFLSTVCLGWAVAGLAVAGGQRMLGSKGRRQTSMQGRGSRAPSIALMNFVSHRQYSKLR
jgi:hypothetical protein